MKYLTFKEVNKRLYNVLFNKIPVGSIEMQVGGDFLFFEERFNNGGWSWYILQEIAEKLKELNEPIDNAGIKDSSDNGVFPSLYDDIYG